MVDEIRRQRQLVRQIISAEVQNTLNSARQRMVNDPDGAIQELKIELENVRRAAELDPDVRAQFIDQLQVALTEARNREVSSPNSVASNWKTWRSRKTRC